MNSHGQALLGSAKVDNWDNGNAEENHIAKTSQCNGQALGDLAIKA